MIIMIIIKILYKKIINIDIKDTIIMINIIIFIIIFIAWYVLEKLCCSYFLLIKLLLLL